MYTDRQRNNKAAINSWLAAKIATQPNARCLCRA